ncbi:SEC14-like protein 2 [Araneus ventricosus]|uniref:SEC14-like protein 2 n=1 Tax=Araneus ventricosus TaxID=182803 RepID=A0A4Y2QZ77_ARAVE|nr:SEC14-like protein 2 [Araneus ventricosus]
MFQDNYPERMKRIYHINASIYHNVLMSVVKTVMATPLLQKIQCFGQAGWKEALLEDIDADVLPAFLGGNRTDPDGNRLCKTFITHGEKIPEEYYLCNYEKTLSRAPGAQTLTIARRSKEEVSFEVREPGSQLEWEFELKEWDKDIKFAVLFTENSSEESKAVEMVQKRRVDTCYGPEKASIQCQKKGTYVLLFDNTYSWMHPKEVAFRARVRSSGDDGNLEWT